MPSCRWRSTSSSSRRRPGSPRSRRWSRPAASWTACWGRRCARWCARPGSARSSDAEGLQLLADREGIAELRSLAGAWQLSHTQGLPLAPAILSLAETVRDRRRAQLLEEGGKAAVRMLFPVTLFIFPVFLVVLLYPAGVELLGLGN